MIDRQLQQESKKRIMKPHQPQPVEIPSSWHSTALQFQIQNQSQQASISSSHNPNGTKVFTTGSQINMPYYYSPKFQDSSDSSDPLKPNETVKSSLIVSSQKKRTPIFDPLIQTKINSKILVGISPKKPKDLSQLHDFRYSLTEQASLNQIYSPFRNESQRQEQKKQDQLSTHQLEQIRLQINQYQYNKSENENDNYISPKFQQTVKKFESRQQNDKIIENKSIKDDRNKKLIDSNRSSIKQLSKKPTIQEISKSWLHYNQSRQQSSSQIGWMNQSSSQKINQSYSNQINQSYSQKGLMNKSPSNLRQQTMIKKGDGSDTLKQLVKKLDVRSCVCQRYVDHHNRYQQQVSSHSQSPLRVNRNHQQSLSKSRSSVSTTKKQQNKERYYTILLKIKRFKQQNVTDQKPIYQHKNKDEKSLLNFFIERLDKV